VKPTKKSSGGKQIAATQQAPKSNLEREQKSNKRAKQFLQRIKNEL
jgi:hypothetical protein